MAELSWLVERSREGDLNAFRQLVRRFQDMAHGYAYSILGDFHLAEDAAQEAFIDAYYRLDALREPVAFPGWFRRIVFKHCDRIARKKEVATVPLEEGMQISQPHPERSELQERVLSAIRALPEPQREATTLYYINGYSQNEIADFLEVPVTTVRKRLQHSRKKLKERMLGMVEDTLKGHALPDEFAHQTIGKVVEEAHRLNAEGEHGRAERLVRDALSKAPGHPGALLELNRAVMRGQVYGNERWDLLPQLVEHGRVILAAGQSNDYVCREVARTLLAIPAMPEATAFIEDWIARSGPNLDRLSMLAWAKGCTGDYDATEELWARVLQLAHEAATDNIRSAVPFACDALVDCLSAAGETDRAQRTARAGWEVCVQKDAIQPTQRHLTGSWPRVFKQAVLEAECDSVARACLARATADPEPHNRVEALCMRVWLGDTSGPAADWNALVQEQTSGGNSGALQEPSYGFRHAFAETGRLCELQELAHTTWRILGESTDVGAKALRRWWDYVRFEGVASSYLWAGDQETAERIAREGVAAERGACWWVINDLAIVRGDASPPELMKKLSEDDPSTCESYAADGWYHIAREAAAAGNMEKAFHALRQACRPWVNPPFWHQKLWEKDTRWGKLRNHREFERILDERRQRIGPVYGELKYFPGW